MEAAIIILCLLLSAFFSGMEIAYVSANKIYLGVESKQLTFFSRVLTRLTEKPSQFITSMLVGNSIALVVYAYHMGKAIMRWIGPDVNVVYAVLLQIFISSLVILLTAEFLPKVFFQVYANRLIKLFALPAYGFYYFFSKVSRCLIYIADFILIKFLRTKGDRQQAFFSTSELGNYINEQISGVDEQEEIDSEIQIFQNALEFPDLKARDIMTPRTEIAAVEINESLDELKKMFVETGYSKIMVYKDTHDNIIGYVHSFDLFKKPGLIETIMIPIEHAPVTIFINDLLGILSRKRKSVAVILDEYGGTAGIVTVEDIIEELFGEIDDEHDSEEDQAEEELGNGRYRFSARLDVEYVNEKYGLNLPETDSYSTLGGYVLHNTNDIPGKGDIIKCGDFVVTIEEASGNKIDLITLASARSQ